RPASGMNSTVSGSWIVAPTRRPGAVKFGLAMGIAIFVVSWEVVGVNLRSIFSIQAASDAWKFLSGLFPPDFSPAFLGTVLRATGQTFATAIAATVLSIVFGFPLAVLASANLWRRGILVEGIKRSPDIAVLAAASRFARAVLGFVRAVPDI